MILKEYQREAVDAMRTFFTELAQRREELLKLPAQFHRAIHVTEDTWKALNLDQSMGSYQEKRTGADQECPNFCLKIPTGGGKTLLAAHAIEQFCTQFARRKTGLVLWVVPSEQIFSQTGKALRERDHPVRQTLDAITGNHVKILNKKSRFSPEDTQDNLCIMLLMLQSFSRSKNKREALKIFQDNGNYAAFFPHEFHLDAHQRLKQQIPNLETVLSASNEEGGGAQIQFGGTLMTSLANVIKLLQPLVILDEGHKAKSDLASTAIQECNPAAMVELTATPAETSNVLFSVAGRALADEEMIKLDLNVTQVPGENWKTTLQAAISKLDELDIAASTQKQKTGQYIRPICLIQAERTGKDQRMPNVIHAEDVREYLHETGKIPADAIRVKSSSTNEIEGEDLLSDQSPVRFIITKSALQEGWDCSFAYILVPLAGTKSRNALTQLVGRILRQPLGRKTGNSLLDESYVFAPAGQSVKLLEAIRQGFEHDGLGDLFARVNMDDKPGQGSKAVKQEFRSDEFKKSLNEFALPAFVVYEDKKPRLLKFQQDIVPYLDFTKIELDQLKLTGGFVAKDIRVVGLNFATDAEERSYLKESEKERKAFPAGRFSVEYCVRHLLDLVPNPWVAVALVERARAQILQTHSAEKLDRSMLEFLAGLRLVLEGDGERTGEIQRLARKVFDMRYEWKEIQFILYFNKRILQPQTYFVREDQLGGINKSLFKPITKTMMNNLERDKIDTYDEQDKTLWWYRNPVKNGFCMAGWGKRKFYPDFIITQNPSGTSFDKIVVYEAKGDHLLGNTDTNYKRELVELFNNTDPTQFDDLVGKPVKKIEFKLGQKE
ncbi:MAG: DEAD/DEAH box helicase family protein [Pseudomonadota bacterium]